MSDLLNSASLVMIPSGYKEDIVYSAVPTDGSGDLSFTRASNGTRINSAGLVEVVAWNEISYSEQLQNAAWTKQNSGTTFTLTDNFTTAPNGTTTACKYTWTAMDSAGKYFSAYQSFNLPSNQYTFSVYMKGAVGGEKIYLYNYPTYATTLCTLTTEWQRFTVTFTNAQQFVYIGGEFGQGGMTTLPAGTAYIWGAQLNIGATAKPYFPTTDRLNVPRLTYQNGGGGCPSLLLEKQSTNLLTQSNALTGVSGTTATANNAISPDGTQNAILINGASGYAYAGTSNNFGGGVTTTFSAFIKYKQGVGQASIGIGGQFAAYLYIDGLDDGNIVLTNYAGSGVSGVTTGYEVHANGWYRFWLTATYTGTTGYQEWQISSNTTNTHLWYYGGQNEASSYMTSFIFTSGASATRVADACSKTGISSLIGQTEGVMFLDFEIPSMSSLMSGGTVYAYLYDGSTKDAYIAIYANGFVQAYMFGGCLINTASGYVTQAGRFKMAFAYKANDFVLYINGVQAGTDTSGTIPTFSEFGLQYINSTFASNQKVNQAILFPTRLSNSELASLTTL